MEIKTEDYSVEFDAATATIFWAGSLYLNGAEEYAPISQLLESVLGYDLSKLTLNLQKLEFLNSSGINVLSKFVIKMRQKGNVDVVVLGSKSIPWQVKSLKNLQRLMPGLQLEM
jgi:hypothetical protein